MPDWPKRPHDRAKVRSAHLWRDLVPIFVHANVADSAALRLQRRTLIDSALGMLRNIWLSREDNFDAQDVQAGIRFHLVCASDYSGCGEAVRFVPTEALSDLMGQRLAVEPDREFAEAVILPPPTENAATRPWGLAGYFSSCHLNEMVADYFDHVAQLNEDRLSRRR